MNNKLSVLIVDDDPNIGDTLVDIIDASGYEADFVTSGKDALSLITEKNYDAILMDIRMPGMNGVETLKCIKQYSPMTSIVMITAFAEDKLVEQARIEGALQVLPKPLDLKKIIHFLGKMCRLKTLLVVDDDVKFCDSLRKTLQDHNYRVIVANNVHDALETYHKGKTECILVDVKLDGDNGTGVVNTIRAKDCESVIILMTGICEQFQPLIDEALKEKVEYFIEKPFNFDKIIELIEEVIRKRLQAVLR